LRKNLPDEKHVRRARIILAFFALLSLALGIVFVYRGVSRIAITVSSRNWIEAEGEVRRSHIEPCGKTDNPDCRPLIQYEYWVEDEGYSGSRIYPVEKVGYQKAEAQELVGRFEPGQRVQVFYDPQRPASSLLIQGRLVPSYFISTLLGLFLLLCSICISWAAIKINVQIVEQASNPPDLSI
jgi:hypothetical protein